MSAQERKPAWRAVCALGLLWLGLSFTRHVDAASLCVQPLRGVMFADGTLDEQILNVIAAEAGCPIQWRSLDMSVARRLQRLREGDLDVIPAASVTEDRQRYGLFSIPYRREVTRLYLHHDLAASEGPRSLDDLAVGNWRVAVARQAWFGTHFAQIRSQLLARQLITETASVTAGLALMAASPPRAQVLVADDFTLVLAQRARPVPIRATDVIVHEEIVHLMFSARTVSPDTVQRFDAAIRRLRSKGVLANFLQDNGHPTLVLPGA